MMEKIPKDPYFEFHPDTLQAVRKEYNLHQPGDIEELLRNIEEWIRKQSHFVRKDFSKHFLEVSLILAKGSLERTKKNLDKLCTLKTLVPNFFSKHDVKYELIDLSPYIMIMVLPKMTEDHYRIIMLKAVSTEIDTTTFYDFYRFTSLKLLTYGDSLEAVCLSLPQACADPCTSMTSLSSCPQASNYAGKHYEPNMLQICEYTKAHDYTKGCMVIFDARNVNILAFTMKLNVVDLRNLMSIIMEGYGMRIKGIHVKSESKAVDTLVAIMRQIFSEKVAGRIKIHKTIDSLYEDIPRDILPEDYGGKEKSYKDVYDTLVDTLSTKENVEYFRDICRPGTDERYRHVAQYNNEILGMPGSFRALQVD